MAPPRPSVPPVVALDPNPPSFDASALSNTPEPAPTMAARALDMTAANAAKKTKTTKAKGGKKKTTQAPKKKSKAKPKAPNKKLKTSKEQKAFKLTADKSIPDPLIMQTVAFDLGDATIGAKLVDFFGGFDQIKKYYRSIAGNKYLFGTVTRSAGLRTTATAYYVQWQHVELSESSIDLTLIIRAINLAKRLKKLEKNDAASTQGTSLSTKNPIPDSLSRMLSEVEDGEEGTSPLSDDDDDGEDELGFEDLAEYIPAFFNQNYEHGYADDWLHGDEEEKDDIDSSTEGFKWVADERLRPPAGVSKFGNSTLKADKRNFFMDELGSALAFLPIRLWQALVVYANEKAHHLMKTRANNLICGARWAYDTTLKEIMQYYAMLIFMTLRPTPGQPYTSCWDDPGWHPYTKYFHLRRFQQLRTVMSFNHNDKPEDSNDALFRIRPLLNTVKHTFPLYLNVGDEVALDEASQASRSKYAGLVIFFNPTKPTGKFHFRYYLLCDCTTNAILRIQMATRNQSDVGDGYDDSPAGIGVPYGVENTVGAGPKTTGLDDDDDNNSDDDKSKMETKEERSRIESLVLDMCQPLVDSGRTVNMDNYYTSPKVAELLLKKGIHMRGTCRASRVAFPQGVKFSKTEAKHLGRGQIKYMVELRKKIAAMGWTDGNPVHFLTTADGVTVAEVNRRVGKDKKSFPAPGGVRKYNKYMKAVDLNDQLRALFSLSHRHGFKKYYKKIGLGLIDMALTQAWVHFALANPTEKDLPQARYNFMNNLAKKMMQTDWVGYISTEAGFRNELIFKDLVTTSTGDVPDDMSALGTVPSVATAADPHCRPVSVANLVKDDRNKRRGFACQVCVFEGRGTGIVSHVVMCMGHRIRCCTTVRNQVEVPVKDSDLSWRAPAGMTCWQKAHNFYIPKGLFRDMVHPLEDKDLDERTSMSFQHQRVGSDIFKKRNLSFGRTVSKRGRKSSNTSTSNKRRKETPQEDESEEEAGVEEVFGTPQQQPRARAVPTTIMLMMKEKRM